MQLQEVFMDIESINLQSTKFWTYGTKQACPGLCSIKEVLYIPCMHVPQMIHYQCENENLSKYN